MSRVAYDPAQFKHENTCGICLDEYQSSDVVTQLRCDTRHYFHVDCLEGWVKSGKNCCPYCREPIQIFEFE